MNVHDNFETLFTTPLDLDEGGIERGDSAIVGQQNLRLLLRENHIGLAKGKSRSVQSDNPSLSYYDVPLICAVLAHPECRFRWARLIVDFSPTKDALIRDMAPREVRGDKPVELKITVGVGLKFELAPNVLGTEAKSEYAASRTIYYPEIVSIGPGFTKGYWDFLALSSDFLFVNRELRLLVSAPVGIPLKARFNLRAKVQLAGFAGMIPLLARSGEINEIYSLD